VTKNKKLDYLFLLWGMSSHDSLGAVNGQIYSIANKLSKDKNKVGVVYISYYSVVRKYNMVSEKGILFRIKSYVSRIIYSRPISAIKTYFFRKKDGKILDRNIEIYLSGTHLKKFRVEHIVTSYWWAIMLAEKVYPHNDLYFIVYHDYCNDVLHSNSKNIPELQRAYKSSNLILANKALMGKFPGNYPLITEGIDIEKFKCKDGVNKKIDNMVLVPLRNNPLKGAEYAIAAMNMLHNEFPELKIVAYGDFTGDVNDFVEFKHVIQDEVLKEYYCKATYFILPSVVEGIPEPLLEAMAGGCACISTACGGPQEVIDDGVNGILVPVRDPVSIFSAFKKLYQNKNMTKTIMDKAITTTANYDLNRTYEEFKDAINFYRDKKSIK
jgi:glycosyltransferase involved in cell wall biosynthesis